MALAVVMVVFASLSTFIAVKTPAWEANDEPDHTRNVETLVRGSWYRMEPGAGIEAHQPPLYYVLLAGWQKVAGVDAREVQPVSRGFFFEGPAFRHDSPRDDSDHRFLLWLRLPSVVLGLLTIALTAWIARLLSADPWTPVVAAAIVAGVPKFVFGSAFVNNDNLVTLLGAAVTLVAIRAVRATRPRAHILAAVAMGGLVGLATLTKLSAATLGIGVAVAIWFVGTAWRQRAQLLAIAGGTAAVVVAPWLLQNRARYGELLALKTTHDYLLPLWGLGGRLTADGFVLRDRSFTRVVFDDVPARLWNTFWYNSGWNQFLWSWWVYAFFWLALGLALLGLTRRRRDPGGPRRELVVLAAIVGGALLSLWVVAFQTETYQARLVFPALAAIGCLAAVGLERWRLPIAVRFAGPMLGLIGTVVAIRSDIINVAGY